MPRKKLSLSSAVSLAYAGRVVLVIFAVVCVATAIFLWRQQVRYETAYRYAANVATFNLITSDDVEEVQVPVDRQFEVVTELNNVVGKYALHALGAGEMAHPSQYSATPPDRFKFDASGTELPEGTWGYYLSVPPQVLSQVSARDLLTLILADPETEQTVIILDKALILHKSDGGMFVGVRQEQLSVLEGIKAELAEQADGSDAEGAGPAPAYLTWAISQGINPDLPPLTVFDMALNAEALDGVRAEGSN